MGSIAHLSWPCLAHGVEGSLSRRISPIEQTSPGCPWNVDKPNRRTANPSDPQRAFPNDGSVTTAPAKARTAASVGMTRATAQTERDQPARTGPHFYAACRWRSFSIQQARSSRVASYRSPPTMMLHSLMS